MSLTSDFIQILKVHNPPSCFKNIYSDCFWILLYVLLNYNLLIINIKNMFGFGKSSREGFDNLEAKKLEAESAMVDAQKIIDSPVDGSEARLDADIKAHHDKADAIDKKVTAEVKMEQHIERAHGEALKENESGIHNF
ncbi:hypothetical protein H0W91_01940 [Patescibacteria group bacterium]|nr:hypothetical protein [Patescibacteria group bacterium]